MLTPPLPFPGTGSGLVFPWSSPGGSQLMAGPIPGEGWAGRAQPCRNSGLQHPLENPSASSGRGVRCHLQMVPETGTKLGRAAEPLPWGENGGEAGEWGEICAQSAPEGSPHIPVPSCRRGLDQGTPRGAPSTLSPSVVLCFGCSTSSSPASEYPRRHLHPSPPSIPQSQRSTRAKIPRGRAGRQRDYPFLEEPGLCSEQQQLCRSSQPPRADLFISRGGTACLFSCSKHLELLAAGVSPRF